MRVANLSSVTCRPEHCRSAACRLQLVACCRCQGPRLRAPHPSKDSSLGAYLTPPPLTASMSIFMQAMPEQPQDTRRCHRATLLLVCPT